MWKELKNAVKYFNKHMAKLMDNIITHHTVNQWQNIESAKTKKVIKYEKHHIKYIYFHQ